MSSTKHNCLFCKESFEDKEQLQIHFRKHGDPKFNQNAKNTKNGAGNDSQASTEKSTEEEVVGCDVCSDVFPTISKAITHKHKMHPDHDAKYFCPWCGKLFTMKHLYNKHIESSHKSSEENKGSGFHCDYCDVNFFAATAMIYHNKFFHRQDTELAAIGYSKKLKHFDEEVLPIYYCPFCGEEYYNKVNLHKHMGDDHIEENQGPDDVLRCPLCEAIFYHLDAYELHLTFHSSEDLYNEENVLVKSITEFSLEAVPPLMEKVENESQEDDVDMNSMGIENFLQQAMNESNDNDLSNSEGIHHKKKKHKKHKKSKKATITLDEFLSMNTDVFGEGLDVQVQGIEEVPSQVVAKQLRKPQNVRKRPTAIQSKEIEKLRKQGIVITKKPRPNTYAQGVVSKTTSSAIPRNVKSPHIPPSKPTSVSTSSDILNKLLNQGNSQIKIVKQSSPNNLTSESKTGKDPPDPNESPNENNERLSMTSDVLNKLLNQGNSQIKIVKKMTHNIVTESQTGKDPPDPNKSENVKDELNWMEFEGQETDKINNIAKLDNPTQENNTGEIDTTLAIPLKWKDDPPYDNVNFESKTEETLRPAENNANSNTAMNALKSISQHITIKQVLNSKSNTEDGKDTIEENTTVLGSEASNIKTTEENNKIVTESQSSNKVSLDALKYLSNLTVKSVNQTKQDFSKNCKESADTEAGLTIAKTTTDEKRTIDKQGTITPLSKSLEALKNISKHITVKAPNNSTKVINSPDKIMDTENEEKGQKQCDSETESDQIQGNNHTIKVSQNKPKLNSLDALKNISKHITVKAQNKLPEINSDEKIDSDYEHVDQCDFDDEHEKKSSMMIDNFRMSTNHDMNDMNNSRKNSINTLKSISKHVTVKAPNKFSPVIDGADSATDSENDHFGQDEFDPENNGDDGTTAMQNSSNFTRQKYSPKPQSETIDALKNLSKHITVKAPGKASQLIEDLAETKDDFSNTNKQESSIAVKEKHDPKPLPNVQNKQEGGTKSLDALKNVSKYLTVKSLNKTSNERYKTVHDDNHEDEPLQDKHYTKNLEKLPGALNSNFNFKSPEIRKMSPNNSVSLTPKHRQNVVEAGVETDLQIVKKQPHLNIMKQLPNITAKQCDVTKTYRQVESSSQTVHLVKSNFQAKNQNVQKCVQTKQKSEAIETLNIYDSEDEEANSTHKKESEPVAEDRQMKSNNALNIMKKLNSSITIKSSIKKNPQEINASPNSEDTFDEDFYRRHSNDSDDMLSPEPADQRSTILQETLKNLSKNLSIKSASSKSQHLNHPRESIVCHSLCGNSKSSPKRDQHKNIALSNTLKNIGKHVSVKTTKTAKMESQEYYEAGHDDSDPDTNTNVKITEIENDCSSDEETISTIKNKIKNTTSNMTVKHPSENDSDNEDFDPSNFEDQIQTTLIKKQPELGTDNTLVKYDNRNPSLKSLQDLNFDEEDEDNTGDNISLSNINRAMPSKPSKFRSNDIVANNMKTNQKVSTSGQINTVNKEVTVQTFKTQTVIEEITTTVTKTIRTVNQAVNQEIRSSSQSCSLPQIRQKVQGLKPTQTSNLRGVQVQQPRPTVGMKVRNSVPTRPGFTPVRPSNPMTAIRPNMPRPQNSRMPVASRGPNSSGNAQKLGSRPITVAPNVVVASTKRPQETMGHFSCFKKPKESLIPVPEIPTMSSLQSNSSSAQLKSTAQMSKSNFSSTTKVVKGNSMMTSSQVKSQTSNSIEQFSKLSNMSGLKVVKSSQKQSTQLEERCEVSAPKRNALEAIERLQRQGLLIKKPRADDQYHAEHSGDSEYDDD